MARSEDTVLYLLLSNTQIVEIRQANEPEFWIGRRWASESGTIATVNGATQSVVGKGRDEQRVPFSNLLDDIGGQEPQSSEEFLLCQLRQPSSRDATAQLFGVARTRRSLLS